VPGRIVDLLQTVDVDERNHKPFAVSARPLHLTLELFYARSAPSDMGQLINLGRLAVKRSLNPIARRHQTITRGLLAFGGRPETIGCSIGAIIRSPPAITRDPQHLLARHRTITRLSAPVPSLGYSVALRSHPIALLSCETPRARRIQTSTRVPDSHLGRVLTSRADLAPHLRTGARRQFLIAGKLILIRGELITIRRRLILIRRRLIPIGGRLIPIRRRLVLLGSCPA
jgi:hypothetical protein